MRFPGFIGPSYTLNSVDADCQRCVNLYPELNETGTGKEREVASLVGTPGLRLLSTLGSGPIRGMWKASTGDVFAVSGSTLYSLNSSWVATTVGTISTSAGPVSLADNGIQLVLVDGTYGYYVTLATPNSVTQITDPDFLAADQVTFQDGYFIFNRAGYGTFFFSSLNGVAFDALDIATVEGLPDKLVGLISNQRNLYLFGDLSCEVFYNSGDADNPFARIQGALVPVGCMAPFSIAKLEDAVYWLGQSESGRGIVYAVSGFQTKRISTHAIEKVIGGFDNLSEARAWAYQQGGHGFYCLNIPGANSTWVYDTNTGLWHERTYLSLGIESRHRADCHVFAFNTNVIGDYANGKVYALDRTKYTDDGAYIARTRTAPHITKELRRIFHQQFQLDMETGVGVDGTGQGDDPQAMLQWSSDGGHTWSSERWTDVGALGNYRTRVTWRRLGHARDRVYRVKITDPVKITLLGADLLVEEALG